MPNARFTFRTPELTIPLPSSVYAGHNKTGAGRELILQGDVDDLYYMLQDALSSVARYR